MYHLELRQFPHVVRRFNLSEREVLAVVVPWVREEWVQFGDRKWNANLAKLTLLEGPQLSLPELALGRGWRNAQRKSKDVTERLLAELKARDEVAVSAGLGAAPPAPAAGTRTEAAEAPGPAGVPESSAPADIEQTGDPADSIGLEILALVDQAPVPLLRVWRLAHARPPERPAGESLALAERTVRSLLDRRLVALQAAPDRSCPSGGAPLDEALAGERVELALRAPESWGPDEPASGQAGAILVRRA